MRNQDGVNRNEEKQRILCIYLQRELKLCIYICRMSYKVLALGDSWFHYPNSLDRNGKLVAGGFWNKLLRAVGISEHKGVGNIIKYLASNHNVNLTYSEKTFSEIFDATFHIMNSADDVLGCCGEELLLMVYGYRRKDPSVIVHTYTWLDMLIERISAHANEYDKFVILLSAGGNDITADNLVDFLYDANNADGPVNKQAINKAVNEQMRAAYQEIFKRICTTFPTKNFHFLFHGYAYPPVNGRGVFTELEHSSIQLLHKLSPGPWLQPGFVQEKIAPRSAQEEIIGNFIDMFNSMLASLQSSFPNGNLHYIDLRNVTDKISRDKGWCNELHFDSTTYPQASKKYYEVIQKL